MTPHQMSIYDLADGARLRDEGMARVTEASEEDHVRYLDTCIRILNHSGRDWSANALREYLADTINGRDILAIRPQLIGARVRAAAMRKEMVRVGYEPSTLPSTHSHPIAVWRGVS